MQDLQPDNVGQGVGLPSDQPVDKEGAMAKADLYKLATYSFKLFKKIQDEDQMEAWVQAKITKAADYIASVYHYLEYEMEFSEYGKKIDSSDVYNESQKRELKAKLNEAKEMVKKLKVEQAEKLSKKDQKVSEGIFGGDQQACEACGGTGHTMAPERQVPETVKAKVATYNRKAKAMHAASKRIDKNKNGIPDDEEFAEDQGELKKTGDTKKTRTGTLTKTDTGVIHKNTSYHDDGDEISANAKSGKGIKSHAKSQSAAEKKEKAPKLKQSPKSAKTWGMKDSEKFDNRDNEIDEMFGQGVYEAKKSPKAKKDYDKDGKVESEKDEVIGSRRKAAGLDEAAPSAGMTKKEKSAVVKKAVAGKDIGKPGKGFEKVEKAAKAGGAKDPKAVAAAAMWKTAKKKAVKENTEMIPQVEPSQEDPAMSEANMTDAQFKAALEKVRAQNPQALAAALNSSDPAALNKLLGFKLSPGEKMQPAIGDDDQGTLPMPNKAAQKPVAPLRESADLDRMKEFLTRLNG